MVRRLLLIAATVSAALLATTATAQEADDGSQPDWDLVDQNGALLATVVYQPGLIVGLRCRTGDLDAFVAGLPPVDEDVEWTRSLELAADDGDFSAQNWVVTNDPTIAFSMLPAPFARRLREGGVLQVRAVGQDGRRLRYVMDLPASPSAIDAVLTRCRKPLVDPRDAALAEQGPVTSAPAGRTWVQRPAPHFPNRGYSAGRGSATLSCIATAGGALGDCVVESEYPRDHDFGRASLQAVSRASIDPAPAGSPPARVVFTVSYRLADF